MRVSKGKVIFDIFNYGILGTVCLLIIIPFMHIISVSLSSSDAILKMNVGIFPKGINVNAYSEILKDKIFFSSFLNSVFVTAFVAILGLVINNMAAYAFSKKFFGKKFLTYVFVTVMYFYGGLIPFYLVVSKYLKLYNNYLAFILPMVVNVFYIIIIRSQIEQLPPSLTESAKIDGAREYQVLFKIVIPSIKPTLAAIGMFMALNAWNSWFNVMLFTNKKEMWTLQYYLRTIINDKSMENMKLAKIGNKFAEVAGVESTQMAAIILVALPIVMVYPFVQQYFVKGLLLGAVKE